MLEMSLNRLSQCYRVRCCAVPVAEWKICCFMFCLPCIAVRVYQYNGTNLLYFLFSLLRIKGVYMFRVLRAHSQEALHRRHLVYCVRIISVAHNSATALQYGKDRQATDCNTIWRMRVTCCITKTTDTHTECVIITAFLLQQWFLERTLLSCWWVTWLRNLTKIPRVGSLQTDGRTERSGEVNIRFSHLLYECAYYVACRTALDAICLYAMTL
jgi:hypothetical protein